MSITDVILITGLIAVIPFLIKAQFEFLGLSKSILIAVGLGGIVWIGFSFLHESINMFMGLTEGDLSDSHQFEKLAYAQTVNNLEKGEYLSVIKWFFWPGRRFYVTYQGLVYYFTGATSYSIVAINSFMAFWGSLSLTRLIYSYFPISKSKRGLIIFFIIFTPSVVFWTSDNLKEALVYWAICQIYSLIITERYATRYKRYGFFLIGVFLGGLLRPHLIIIWILCVIFIESIHKRSLKFIIVLIVISVSFLSAVLVLNKPFRRRMINQNFDFAKVQMNWIIERGDDTTFDYGKTGPIPVVSGAINILFRPFIWKVKNTRMLLASLEIWVISIGIILLWIKMGLVEVKKMLCNPLIQVALLVLVPYFILFSYLPNEGLIARQRIQLYPALLVFFVAPILYRGPYRFSYVRTLKKLGKMPGSFKKNGREIETGHAE